MTIRRYDNPVTSYIGAYVKPHYDLAHRELVNSRQALQTLAEQIEHNDPLDVLKEALKSARSQVESTIQQHSPWLKRDVLDALKMELEKFTQDLVRRNQPE